MAKKAKTTKKARGKRGPRAARTVTHIHYECDSGCVASVHQAYIGRSPSVVVLSAIGTDVTLDFSPYKGSPFKGGRKKISIKADKSKQMQVDSGIADDTYPYDLTCSACSTTPPPGPPEMIVP